MSCLWFHEFFAWTALSQIPKELCKGLRTSGLLESNIKLVLGMKEVLVLNRPCKRDPDSATQGDKFNQENIELRPMESSVTGEKESLSSSSPHSNRVISLITALSKPLRFLAYFHHFSKSVSWSAGNILNRGTSRTYQAG